MGYSFGGMSMMKFESLAWHRSIGKAIEELDQPDFWIKLVRLLSKHVHFESWVVLRFCDNERPVVLAEISQEDGLPDPLFEDYLNVLYLLDPFHIAAKDNRKEGVIHLDEVAPDRFDSTEYCKRYFRINIVEDEIQFNCLLEQNATLCLSLGSHQKFTSIDMTVLSLISQWVIPLMHQRWRYEVRTDAPEAFNKLLQVHMPNGPNAFRLIDKLLSSRELEISQLMLSGFSSKGIAQKLLISPETVKVHRKHMYSKLGINSQSELFSMFMNRAVKTSDRAG